MIAISSFRPFDKDPDGSYRRNQLFAFQSWQRVFSKIYFFNSHEKELASAKTTFIPSPEHPTVLSLVELAAMQDEWCAILNSDIVIGQNFPQVEAKLRMRKASCAASWRFNFDPAIGIQSGVHNDNGLDFFTGTPEVWRRCYEMIDDRLCIGSGGWDQYMLSFFGTYFQTGFFNITPARVIFHPGNCPGGHGARIHGPRVELDLVQTYIFPTMTSAKIM